MGSDLGKYYVGRDLTGAVVDQSRVLRKLSRDLE